MFCNYCGKRNPKESKYCSSCGSKIIKTSTKNKADSFAKIEVESPRTQKGSKSSLWHCEYCYKEFDTEMVAVEHEEVCVFNPETSDKYFNEQEKYLIEQAKLLANREMKLGVIWFGIALLITGSSYLFASEGGSYFIFWGAMVYGLYRLIQGLRYKQNPKLLLKKAQEEKEKENK